ncbi:MAG: rhodanese-like domain-containing protein [Verrucomicrobia bacterium]|nr:rhodanese-like domain-containing protein [Verrucomicrobiota bacterium]MBV8275539.1 rhodanese-like domain-containing protein [Verrucomicrobiota bacterium]
MTALRQAGLILLIALGLAGVTAAVHPKRPSFLAPPRDPNEVTLAETKQWAEKVLWVDARSASEFASGHVPDAVCLNFENWSEEFPKFLDLYTPGQRVVVYCSATSCQLSREIAAKLKASGVDGAYFLEGGWEAWKQQNRQ